MLITTKLQHVIGNIKNGKLVPHQKHAEISQYGVKINTQEGKTSNDDFFGAQCQISVITKIKHANTKKNNKN